MWTLRTLAVTLGWGAGQVLSLSEACVRAEAGRRWPKSQALTGQAGRETGRTWGEDLPGCDRCAQRSALPSVRALIPALLCSVFRRIAAEQDFG